MQNEISARIPFIIMESNNSQNGPTHTYRVGQKRNRPDIQLQTVKLRIAR